MNGTSSDNEIINDTSTDIINNDTEFISDIGNFTSLTNINILGIKLVEDFPSMIIVNCESFNKIDNENMILLFTSKDNSNSFQTETCILPNSQQITSFSCKLPDNIPNGEYIIQSPLNNKYSINYPNNLLSNDGIISFINNNLLLIQLKKK